MTGTVLFGVPFGWLRLHSKASGSDRTEIQNDTGADGVTSAGPLADIIGRIEMIWNRYCGRIRRVGWWSLSKCGFWVLNGAHRVGLKETRRCAPITSPPWVLINESEQLDR
ncbi:MAG: hypothetical protein J3Q66DRAFT_386374 [Benniella sp.]|nr:MAG: hypothetical protein J3Q66DRAFT_386374 [Benniella sp.]